MELTAADSRWISMPQTLGRCFSDTRAGDLCHPGSLRWRGEQPTAQPGDAHRSHRGHRPAGHGSVSDRGKGTREVSGGDQGDERKRIAADVS